MNIVYTVMLHFIHRPREDRVLALLYNCLEKVLDVEHQNGGRFADADSIIVGNSVLSFLSCEKKKLLIVEGIIKTFDPALTCSSVSNILTTSKSGVDLFVGFDKTLRNRAEKIIAS